MWHEDRRIFIAIQHRLRDRRILIIEPIGQFVFDIGTVILTPDISEFYLQTRSQKLLFILYSVE